MPRTYPKATKLSRGANASRAYRQKTKHITSVQAAIEGSTPTDTLTLTPVRTRSTSTARTPPPDDPVALVAADDSLPFDDKFSSRQVALLQAYIACDTDPMPRALELCESVGYHPSSVDSAQSLLRYILSRVTELDDLRRAMRTVGMGEMWWLRRIFHIAQCGSPRVEVQAAKLAGLALGAFDDPAPSAGAKVIIESASTPDGRRVERTSIEGAAEVRIEGNSLSFPVAKPTKRKRILKNLT